MSRLLEVIIMPHVSSLWHISVVMRKPNIMYYILSDCTMDVRTN